MRDLSFSSAEVARRGIARAKTCARRSKLPWRLNAQAKAIPRRDVAAAVIAYAVLRMSGDGESASETNEEEELLGMIAGNWDRLDKDP